jgi:hypothetical protein
LGCSSTPPTISSKVIRNFGASFCGLNLDDLTTTKLNAKPKKKVPVGNKNGNRDDQSSSNASHDDEAASGSQ